MEIQQLWFGDERGYNATKAPKEMKSQQLWFGDERGYNATEDAAFFALRALWFGDERGYNATGAVVPPLATGCGLVMKEDITQLARIW